GGAIIENPIVGAGAVVTGAGSTWNVSNGLAVGNVMAGGTGVLTVSAGGAVHVTGDTLIAADTDWTGLGASSVVVTGRNSSLSTVGLEIGTHACGCGDLPGELSVADGGTVAATGPVKIGALGILKVGSGGTAGSFVAPSIQNDGRIVADFTDTATLGANVSGAGSLTKSGAGTLVLNGQNSFTGGTTVGTGKLVVGDAGHSGARLAGPVTVAAGGALGGAGTLTGNVTVDGTLAAGNSPGTLTFDRNLTLNAGATSVFELNSPGVVGGSHPASGNDLVVVNGNLKLGGTLQANVAAAGYYRLINYRSMVPGSSFAAETVISSNGGFTVGSHELIYGVPNQVNLIVLGTGQTIQFWDGSRTSANGAVDGGSGTWNVADTNWTDVAGAANRTWMRSVGVFGGTAGTVSVAGTQRFDTLQFSTDGYTLQGGTLSFGPAAGTSGTIQVDNNVTATIGSVLANGATATGLTKTGGGTLVLNGNNQYTGGTSLLGGVLSVSSDANLGRGGAVAFGGGTLATTSSFETARIFSLTTNGLIDVADGTTLQLTGTVKGAGDLV
ncbi:autotransporter-associated beta strand repeat-containing protein, partial [Rhizobiaceae sp. 2RAB30]